MPSLHWTPTAQDICDSGLEAFRVYVNNRYGTAFEPGDYWSLHAWSVSSPENINNYWNAVWDWSGVIGDKGQQPLFDAAVPMYESGQMARYARLNWAENALLAHKHARSRTQTAVISCVERLEGWSEADACMRKMSFDELYIEVAQAASRLKQYGIKPGDRVAALTPNNAEAIVMVLATSSLGAVWSASPPEFGVTAILQRFTQFRPKVLLTADEYRASGKTIQIAPKLAEIVPELQRLGLQHVAVVGQLHRDRKSRHALPNFKGVETIAYTDFLDTNAREITFWRGPAAASLWVLYSSAGKPKAIIHSQLGMVLTIKAQSWMHYQMQAGDCYLQITTTGWMMWNEVCKMLCSGLTVVAYDGNPLYPKRDALFDLVDAHKVACFALSPRYLQVLLQGGFKPKQTHSLKSLRTIFSAGSPLKPELYDYIRDGIKDVYIANGSGGTDICSGFTGGCPILPIYKGLIQVPMLGTALECYGDDGVPVPNGAEGHLVVTKPFPNLPLGLLGDDARHSKLKETYFSQWPDKSIWYQGDYMQIEAKSRGTIMLGRSDGVLNPQGVRFGSAEIYTIIEEMKDEIDDCIAVGQKLPDGDERVIVFLKLLPDKTLSPALVERMRAAITAKLSRRHVPAKFIECPEIPYTANGKRVEVAVKKVINGAAPASLNTSGMLNPRSLNFFVGLPELALVQDRLKSKL